MRCIVPSFLVGAATVSLPDLAAPGCTDTNDPIQPFLARSVAAVQPLHTGPWRSREAQQAGRGRLTDPADIPLHCLYPEGISQGGSR